MDGGEIFIAILVGLVLIHLGRLHVTIDAIARNVRQLKNHLDVDPHTTDRERNEQ